MPIDNSTTTTNSEQFSRKFSDRTMLFGVAVHKFNDDAIEYAYQHEMILFHPDGQRVRTDISACALVHPASDTSV